MCPGFFLNNLHLLRCEPMLPGSSFFLGGGARKGLVGRLYRHCLRWRRTSCHADAQLFTYGVAGEGVISSNVSSPLYDIVAVFHWITFFD